MERFHLEFRVEGSDNSNLEKVVRDVMKKARMLKSVFSKKGKEAGFTTNRIDIHFECVIRDGSVIEFKALSFYLPKIVNLINGVEGEYLWIVHYKGREGIWEMVLYGSEGGEMIEEGKGRRLDYRMGRLNGGVINSVVRGGYPSGYFETMFERFFNVIEREIREADILKTAVEMSKEVVRERLEKAQFKP